MTISSKTTLTTPKANGYVTQLCKHFGHKIKVEQSGDTVVFHFSVGIARVQAEGDRLTLHAQGETAHQLREVETIMGSHLERFAFREDLRVVWPEITTIE